MSDVRVHYDGSRPLPLASESGRLVRAATFFSPVLDVDSMEGTGSTELPQAREAVRDSNPFQSFLADRTALPARCLSETPTSQVSEAATAASLELLGDLTACEAQLGIDHANAFYKTRLGAILLLADSQARLPDAEMMLPVARQILARNIEGAKTEIAAAAKTYARVLAGSEANVQALVQRALRESYLLGSALLADFAHKVQFYNDLKKRIREEAARTRDAMRAMAGKTDSARLTAPFTKAEFNTRYMGDDSPLVLTSSNVLAGSSAHSGGVGGWPQRTGTFELTTSRDYGDSSHYSTIDKHGDTSAAALLRYINSLGPEEAAALAHYWEDHGISVYVHVVDTDGSYDNYKITKDGDGAHAMQRPTITKSPDESLESFVARAYDQLFSSLRGWMKDQEGNTNIESIKTIVGIPVFGALSAERVRGAAPNAGGPASTASTDVRTKADCDAYLKELEDQLNSVGDDAQLANVDLQNELQKQQQLLQTLSNIAKVLHDTILSVVRKIGS